MSNCLDSLKSALEVEHSDVRTNFLRFPHPFALGSRNNRQSKLITNSIFQYMLARNPCMAYHFPFQKETLKKGSNFLLRQMCKIELKFYLHDEDCEDCEDCEECVLATITTEKKGELVY